MSDKAAVQRRRRLDYPELEAGGFTRLDGSVDFYNRVNALVSAESVVLDFGAGRGEWLEDPVAYRRELRRLRGRVGTVVGVDVDPVVSTNPACDAHVVMPDLVTVPIADSSVDLVIADHVFEHVAEPVAVALELGRVLRPGGWLCARTPNRFGYIGIGTNLIPNRAHVRLLRRLQPERKAEDVFPTTYLLNTRRQLRRHFPPDGWELYMYSVNAEPAYFGSSKVSWGAVRFASRFLPQWMGAKWLIFLRKRPTTS